MANNFAEAFFGGINDARQSRAQQEQADQSRLMNTMRIEDAQQQRQVSQQQALYGLAKGYKDYLANNPQGGAQYYERFLKPSLAGLGLGDAGPYNEPEAVALADQVLAAYSGGGQPSAVQSTFVDQAGNRVAIMRDGTTQVLGQNAPNNQIIDTGNGYVGVNKGSLQANPVMLGGIPPGGQFSGPDGMPIQIDPNLPPAVQQAISANPSAWAGAPDGASVQLPNQQAPQQLRSAPKPQAAPAGYQYNASGTLDMIPGGPAQVAADARNEAAAARRAADEAKAEAANQATLTRQSESAAAAQGLIDAIDTLTESPGYSELGTTTGDFKLSTPYIRSDVKDSDAQLKNIGGQVALATMARLRSLSSQGATGFGALSQQELKLLENALATLSSDQISNSELTRSLRVIRNSMKKAADWKPPAAQSSGPARPTTDAEYNALPSGAEFIDPDDGQTYRKP